MSGRTFNRDDSPIALRNTATVVIAATKFMKAISPGRSRKPTAPASIRTISTTTYRFDASATHCYRARDRQRLLAVVEAGFGDFDGFNRIVRGIFVDARTQNLEAQVAAQAAAVKRLATLRPEDFDGPLSA